MHSVIEMGLRDAHTSEVVEHRVSLRLQQQKILTRRSPVAPHIDVIFDVSALLRGFESDVMIDQLTRLTTLTELPNLSIRVVPFEAAIWANLAELALDQADSSRLIHAVTERWTR